jgi:6-pyruvoyl-tetrahydropterin synthase
MNQSAGKIPYPIDNSKGFDYNLRQLKVAIKEYHDTLDFSLHKSADDVIKITIELKHNYGLIVCYNSKSMIWSAEVFYAGYKQSINVMKDFNEIIESLYLLVKNRRDSSQSCDECPCYNVYHQDWKECDRHLRDFGFK